MAKEDKIKAGDKVKQWCFWCNEDTLHTYERVRGLFLEKGLQRGALSPRCENSARHPKNSKAA